jgi:predicted DCC family thiol-disulfide oxidoreductase YuxK
MAEPAETGMAGAHEGAALVYDGACPFCSGFARLVRLRAAVGEVRLINARDGGPEVTRLRAAGIDLDRGSVFIYGGRDYVGAESVAAVAMLSGLGGVSGRIVGWLFRAPSRARLAYPLLRGLRNLALAVKRRPSLADHWAEGGD